MELEMESEKGFSCLGPCKDFVNLMELLTRDETARTSHVTHYSSEGGSLPSEFGSR